MKDAFRQDETPSEFARAAIVREIDARMTEIQARLAERVIDTTIETEQARIAAYMASERAAGREPTTDDAGIEKMLHVAEEKA